MEWHPKSHVLLAGTADGNSWMWKIPSGECKTFQGPNCPATCGHVLTDGKQQGRACEVGFPERLQEWDFPVGQRQGEALWFYVYLLLHCLTFPEPRIFKMLTSASEHEGQDFCLDVTEGD